MGMTKKRTGYLWGGGREGDIISKGYVGALTIFFFFFFNLFYFWLCWVFVVSRGLSLAAASGGYSSLQYVGFHYSGFSCCRAWALGTEASVVVARGL